MAEWYDNPCSWGLTDDGQYYQAVGTKANPERIKAIEIIKALDDIARNDVKGIRVWYGKVEGDLKLSDCKNFELSAEELIFKYTTFMGEVDFSPVQFRDTCISFRGTEFMPSASFNSVWFEGSTSFIGVSFGVGISFDGTWFRGSTFFDGSKFGERTLAGTFSETAPPGTQFGVSVTFIGARFEGCIFFRNTYFQRPAIFKDIEYWSDSPRVTLARWLWKDGIWGNFLRRILLLPKNSPKGRPQKPTQFYLDSQNIDEVSNPHFKRYVADQQYIRAFKDNHPVIYQLWRKTSNCGRSLSMWAFWSLLIAILFGLAYAHKEQIIFGVTGWKLLSGLLGIISLGVATVYAIRKKWIGLTISVLVAVFFGLLCANIIVVPDSWQPELITSHSKLDGGYDGGIKFREPTWFTYIYFSVVTFTTLGFGDVTPLNTAGEILLTLEVILGYIMLGGLISIFANKLARRS